MSVLPYQAPVIQYILISGFQGTTIGTTKHGFSDDDVHIEYVASPDGLAPCLWGYQKAIRVAQGIGSTLHIGPAAVLILEHSQNECLRFLN